MQKASKNFYRQEQRLCLFAIVMGLIFISLYFFRHSVEQIYYYHFITLFSVGLIYILNFGVKFWELKRIQKNKAHSIDNSELDGWLNRRLTEINKNRKLLTFVALTGFAMIFAAFAGYETTRFGGSGGGLLFGAGLWLGIELVSQFQNEEQLRRIHKK